MDLQRLNQVRDRRQLWAWINDHKLVVHDKGKLHYAIEVDGKLVFISRAPGRDNRSVLNARRDIKRALAS